jgi:GH24 family phage-related lysozyme (muramidase)
MNREDIIDRVAEDEGFVACAKWDMKQFSYGYGCAAPYEGATITVGEAKILLSKRVDQAIQEFHEIFADQPMSDIRQGALVNMVFNLGQAGLQKFKKMIAAIKSDDWEEAANQAKDSEWYRQLKDSGDPPGRARRIVAELRNG